jgi:hypothetical protein
LADILHVPEGLDTTVTGLTLQLVVNGFDNAARPAGLAATKAPSP